MTWLVAVIQAGQMNLAVTSVPARRNRATRPSRLVRSVPSSVGRSRLTIFRLLLRYRPLRSCLVVGTFPFVAGLAPMGRWLLLYLLEDPTRTRAPRLFAAAAIVLAGFQPWTFALGADPMAASRPLLEDEQYGIRRLGAGSGERRGTEP